MADLPMIQLVKECATNIFVPLTIGGGIKDSIQDGTSVTALQVAGAYFRAGADKVTQ